MREFLVALILVPVATAQINPMAGNTAAIDVGKGNFRLYCSPCHGIHAQGGRGPDLTRGYFAAGETDADLFRVVSNGVEGTEMESYSSQFNSDMIWRLIAFIRSVAKVTRGEVPGNAQHGREIFLGKGGCVSCHAVEGQGGDIGPSLSRVGRERSLGFLREKLLTPSRSLTPGYSTVAVTLRDGKTIRGVNKGYDDFSAQLLDVNKHFYSFRREEVLSMSREDQSLMPADYAQKLTTDEQTDLLAYLASLGVTK
ncbi:MAG TPA: c-type cytochrome [Bryobacteraceae bacterium]|jgi:putative heme-binding domain-containing protein